MASALRQAAGRGGAGASTTLIYLVASKKLSSRWPLVIHNQRDVNVIQKLVRLGEQR